MKTINYGIDLGTTNSLIARYQSGKVELFKNPVGHRETLPSCVAYREERLLIGDKAREWLLKDPLNVFAGFKRKMGTSESYFVARKNSFVSPIELSSLILNELRNFIHDNDHPESAVITIPASFDTVQSNATKKAGYEAGFKEVVLLQEPIAASLAFFNNRDTASLNDGKWLVYDLGGGTFDVALIGIDDTEMRVIDNQGDNFLGGLDFDHSIVMDILLPKLVKASGNNDLAAQLNSRQGKFEKLYYILLLKAEEAKKELSQTQKTEVEFSYDINGSGEEDYFLELSRDEFNTCIEKSTARTIEMVHTVLDRNKLSSNQIREIIMIGGSTYIPYVRSTVETVTGIKVNCSADPTTSVAVGAAYYAGSKASQQKQVEPEVTRTEAEKAEHLSLQISYKKSTRDTEEYITGQVENFRGDLEYRIIRSDGGFDSGIKPLRAKFGEFVTLRKDCINEFVIKVYDENKKELHVSVPRVEITHGLFNVFGQPLPEDVSIEVDDVENNATKCLVVFERNSILPLVKTVYREVSRTLKKGSKDKLIINVLEGNSKAHPNTNKGIGVIEIDASKLQGDLIRGSDVEIKIEMSESRDVSVKVNLLLFNQQFSNVFSPTDRYVSLTKLQEEVKELRNTIRMEVMKAEDAEDFERAADIVFLSQQVETLFEDIYQLSDKDLSDKKYQLEEQKRKLAEAVYGTSNNPRIIKIKSDYYDWKGTLIYWCDTFDDMPLEHKTEHQKIMERETEAFASNSYMKVDMLCKAQTRLVNRMIMFTPTLTAQYFRMYSMLPESRYTNWKEAKKAIEAGERALERKNHEELRACFNILLGYSKNTVAVEKISGTGLG